jgi:hypothetical protein
VKLPPVRIFVRAIAYFFYSGRTGSSGSANHRAIRRLIIMKAFPALFLCVAVLASCTERSDNQVVTPADSSTTFRLPPIETRADSVALAVFEACGGPSAWADLRYLRFDFGVDGPGGKRVFRKHLWDRYDGNYRVEWESGTDSTYVILLNVNSRDGEAFMNGKSAGPDRQEELVARGYEAFINDTYWLLAPVKLLDPGVTRSFVPDSSDSQTDVITTTYTNVGLTPGDQFWFWVNRADGKLKRWAYSLQGAGSRRPTSFDWGDYEQFETEGGLLRLIPRKDGATRALVTDNIAMPESVSPVAFTDPNPVLQSDLWITDSK